MTAKLIGPISISGAIVFLCIWAMTEMGLSSGQILQALWHGLLWTIAIVVRW